MRRVAAFVALAMLAPIAAEGQNSVYGIRGVGFPGRPMNVRARSMGGGWAMFDYASAVNPASAANFLALSASGHSATTLRRYTAETTEVSGLKETRFPFAIVGGGIARLPLSFSISFSPYTEQTFDFTTTGTDDLGGVPVNVSDRISSDGGTVDIRGALGWRVLGRRLRVGAAFHAISGSSRIEASREFPDGEFRKYEEEGKLVSSAMGVSTGLLWEFRPNTYLAATLRYDGTLSREYKDLPQPDIDLPLSLGGGISLPISREIGWSTSVMWRSWSKADDDLNPDIGGAAFDTFEVGSGMELGSPAESFPIRLGARYATLPFSPTTDQPKEWSVSGGSGFALANGRVLIDFALERLWRSGAGAREQAWYIAVGLTIEP
jgi:hypothetical protein